MHATHTHIMEQCAVDCLECQRICTENEMRCLEKGRDHAEPAHLLLLKDCASICGLAASFISRGSGFANNVCRISRDICQQCALSCEKFTDDEEMQQCAKICRRCAMACEEMINA